MLRILPPKVGQVPRLMAASWGVPSGRMARPAYTPSGGRHSSSVARLAVGNPRWWPRPSPVLTLPRMVKGRPSIAEASESFPDWMAVRIRLLLIRSPSYRTGVGLSKVMEFFEHQPASISTSPDRFFPKRQLGPTDRVCSEGKAVESSARNAAGSCCERVELKGSAMVRPMFHRSRTRSLWGRPVMRAGCFSG